MAIKIITGGSYFLLGLAEYITGNSFQGLVLVGISALIFKD